MIACNKRRNVIDKKRSETEREDRGEGEEDNKLKVTKQMCCWEIKLQEKVS